MAVTEAEILAEAERGDVVCVIYTGRDALDADALAKDRLCDALANRDLLRLAEVKGSRWSPFGMVKRWIRKT
jgi:hypothetical protein